MRDFRRLAVYFVPRPETALGRFGAGWLGWDAGAGIARAFPEPEGLPRLLPEIVARPRRYGFHATLKAPFRLAAGRSQAELAEALGRVAAAHSRFALALRLEALGPFLALIPEAPSQALAEVAAACVTGLDAFRAPLDPEELARRRASGLDAEEEAMLLRWGYPHVLQTFRFHMTLSGPLPEAERAATEAVLRRRLAGVELVADFADLCLCREAEDGLFHVIARKSLRDAADLGA